MDLEIGKWFTDTEFSDSIEKVNTAHTFNFKFSSDNYWIKYLENEIESISKKNISAEALNGTGIKIIYKQDSSSPLQDVSGYQDCVQLVYIFMKCNAFESHLQNIRFSYYSMKLILSIHEPTVTSAISIRCLFSCIIYHCSKYYLKDSDNGFSAISLAMPQLADLSVCESNFLRDLSRIIPSTPLNYKETNPKSVSERLRSFPLYDLIVNNDIPVLADSDFAYLTNKNLLLQFYNLNTWRIYKAVAGISKSKVLSILYTLFSNLNGNLYFSMFTNFSENDILRLINNKQADKMSVVFLFCRLIESVPNSNISLISVYNMQITSFRFLEDFNISHIELLRPVNYELLCNKEFNRIIPQIWQQGELKEFQSSYQMYIRARICFTIFEKTGDGVDNLIEKKNDIESFTTSYSTNSATFILETLGYFRKKVPSHFHSQLFESFSVADYVASNHFILATLPLNIIVSSGEEIFKGIYINKTCNKNCGGLTFHRDGISKSMQGETCFIILVAIVLVGLNLVFGYASIHFNKRENVPTTPGDMGWLFLYNISWTFNFAVIITVRLYLNPSWTTGDLLRFKMKWRNSRDYTDSSGWCKRCAGAKLIENVCNGTLKVTQDSSISCLVSDCGPFKINQELYLYQFMEAGFQFMQLNKIMMIYNQSLNVLGEKRFIYFILRQKEKSKSYYLESFDTNFVFGAGYLPDSLKNIKIEANC